jgi:formylglycine-generating enzyme required for sulfatase activity
MLLTALLLLAVALSLVPAGEPPKGELYAFLVACQDYDQKELRPLRYARADITAFADVLKDSGFRPDHTTVLRDGREELRSQPTAANVRKGLALLLDAAEEADTVVVALAGHGVQFQGEATAYFCPIDARLEDRTTLIPLDEVFKALEGCKAGRKLLLVDACRDDPQSRLSRAAEKVRVESVTRPPAAEAIPRGLQALFSCDAGQQSFEYPDLGHGVFFHSVIEGWKGKAAEPGKPVTLDSLRRYVRRETKTFAREKLEALQTPVERGELVNADDWVLSGAATPRPASAEPGRAAPNPPQPSAETGRVEGPPGPLDCTGPGGFSKDDVRKAQQAWAKHLGRSVKETVRIGDVPVTFVLIPPGKFLMGSPEGEADRFKNEAQHEVTLTRPFDLMATELTQAQYRALTGQNSSKFPGDDLPVEQVSWTEADDFANKLTERLSDKHLYRLPTEAEWEYACRGGASASKPFGIGEGTSLSSTQANFSGNDPYGGAAKGEYRRKTTRAGSFEANGFGLFDLHGNVWEWCSDWYGDYPPGRVTDPTGQPSGSHRVIRGGSWRDMARGCRSAERYWDEPGIRFFVIGFRLAQVPSGAR